jgi:hypothetical protein
MSRVDPDRELIVKFTGLTEAQAVALEIMFDRWQALTQQGSSRFVGFYVDGDGNFRPYIETVHSKETIEIDDDMRRIAEVSENNFDFDGIAWKIEED